jgi:AcrR family transcriptional regulator
VTDATTATKLPVGYDKRRLRSDERITEATLQLLRGGGPAAVTVEGVAAASGVAKTTIYRRHANRREMLQAALTRLTETPTPAPEVATKEKVRWAVASAREALEDVLGLSSVGAILANQDPEFTESVRAVLTPHTRVLVALMDSAVAAGNVRADADNDTVLSLILGAYLGEQLRFGRIREGWLDHTVDVLWSGVGAR